MGMHVSAGHGKKKGRARPEMNVTPLVDVVLVLLIIFMVVMPAMHRSFWLYLPPAVEAAEERPPVDPSEPIVVTVNERGEYQINQEVYSDATFRARLHRMLVAREERKVYFDAADAAPFERAVEAMDFARDAGAAQIAVMTSRLR